MAEAQTFELLKKKRKSFRTAVTKVVNELEAELSNSDLNVDKLSELVETLSIKFEPLTLVDQQLEPLFKPEQFDGEFEITEEYREKAHLGGSALNTVEGFPISAKAYDEAVELLKNRFANPEILIQAHMSKILSLQPLKNSNDLRSFRKFVDNCDVQLRSLNSLGVSSANYGKILCPMLLKLIPSDLLLDYNKLQQNGSGSDIQQLLSFLTQSLTAREQTYSTNKSSFELYDCRQETKSNFSREHRSHKQQNQKSFRTTCELLTAPVKDNKDKIKLICIFCNSMTHNSNECDYRLYQKVNLEKLKNLEKLNPISWKFIPPQALWWGGFWDHTRRINRNLGKILKLYPSKDEKVRVARVKTRLGSCLHPVQKLYLLKVMEKTKSSVHPTNSPLFSDANEGSHLPINIDPELSKHQAAATPLTQPCSSVSNGGARLEPRAETSSHQQAETSSMHPCSSVSNGGGGLKLRAETSGHQQAETSIQACSSISDGEVGVEPRVETLELPDDLTSDVGLQQPTPRRSRYGRLLKLRKGLVDSY
ncbi:transposon Ty3-G Gag-Pol polyprotein [Trichonephila clavata]|uniref:Transposon Ty3-G Gag-Pol polyprotein n=1 Tax=Trichonephila clavata TaxID=2740835 RepID=A0A8X6LIK9_TRICU|nr:transposon Ty3-G Gag-Pol polyprotein [Trichonephila clavata]